MSQDVRAVVGHETESAFATVTKYIAQVARDKSGTPWPTMCTRSRRVRGSTIVPTITSLDRRDRLSSERVPPGWQSPVGR